MRIIKGRVIRNIGTEAAWSQKNPILLDGEVALVRFGTRVRNKIGNGVLTFSQLSYQDTDLKISVATPSFPFVSGEGPAPAGVYMANGSGIYNGNLEVDTNGKLVMLIWDGIDKLEKIETLLPATEVANDLGQSTTTAISQKVVTDLSGRVDNKVEKSEGKSLVDNAAINKLNDLPDNSSLTASLNNKVDKEEGKGLSTNDYSASDKEKVNKLKANAEGDANKFLNEKGEYKEVIVPEAPVQGIAVDGELVDPDENGIVHIEIPDIEAPVQSVSVNGVPVNPDSAGNVDIQVVQEVEQTINPNSTNAVSSAAVAAEFAGLGAKYGAALSLTTNGEDEDKTYAINLLDENGNILSTTDEFTGGGGGGEVSTTKIVLTKITENPTIKEGDEVVLRYYFDHRDTASDSSTGLSGDATITVISGATSKEIKQRLNADSNNQIDVSEMLLVGNNTVRVRIEVDNGGSLQVSTISWRIQVVTLRLSSTFNFAQLYNAGQAITLPYSLAGSGTKALKLYVDGVQADEKTITTSSSTGSFTISTVGMSHGSHSLQLVAELEVTASNILKSNSIYFDVAVANNGSAPIVATRFEHNDGSIVTTGNRPFVDVKQFQEYTIRYAGYDPANNRSVITVKVNGETLASTNSAFSQLSTSDKKTQNGSFPGSITIGSTVYTFNVAVAQSNINVSEPIDGMKLKLSALGRSNSDANRTEWNFANIKTTFTGVQYEGDGWTGKTLMLRNNGQAVIGYKPLSNAGGATNSFAFQCKFKVTNVSDPNSNLVSCMSGGVGFVITAEEARIVTSGNAVVPMKFAAGREYNIAFVSHPTSVNGSSDYEVLNSQMLYLYIDGIMSGSVQRGNTDSIYQAVPVDITLKGQNATLEVYGMRAYNTYLTDSQVLDLFILDMDNVDDLIAKYNQNAILDNEGNVTVDSLPADARYVIITGQQANGMSTVKYAEAINNKSQKYDVDEILHIVKNKPELNFKCVGGCISLQGTSSLAYPIKNYRTYFRSAASSSVFGQVYTGVDAQGNGGTLVTAAKPKVSFRSINAQGKIPAPVNVWCFKADYAESSSSHNTGFASLVNTISQEAGDKTPAQKHVDPSYQYDVRTTVDGEPCYFFYRNTYADAPKFLGKFNMNNDKSTEEVFGFLNIPGYHDQPWVQDKFAGQNPTQCWEVLNNDYPMGMFLDDDFDTLGEDGKPNWTKVFESRFPDNQDIYNDGTVKPANLERFVKWVKSTQNDPAKFKAELADYADVKHLCSYFTFIQLFGGVDQMVKNTMIAFWYDPIADKILAYYILYDGDTINGVRNDGRLKYGWDIDRQSLDPELTADAGVNKYAFAGHDSVLWNNLESQFAAEIGEAYTRLRARMTNDYILQVFGKNQSEKFSERIFNLDAQYKYVAPKTLGTNMIVGGNVQNTKYSYLDAMQGSRKSHREWWLTNRLELFDGRYSTGQYPLTDISWKGVSDAGAKVTAESSRDFFFEFRRESQMMYRSAVAPNIPWTYTYNQAANVGTIFHLYGGKFMSKLNLAAWGGFTDMNLPNLPGLKELILGMAGKTYTLSEIAIGEKLPMVELIDVRNYVTIPSLDLSACKSLKQLIATGCSNLAGIQLPSGAPLTLLALSSQLRTLNLKGLPLLMQAGITFDATNGIDNLIVENCPLLDWEILYNTLGAVKNIRVTGIDKEVTRDWLDKYKNLGGIDANGNIVSTPRLAGTIYLKNVISDTEYSDYTSRFPELSIILPEYSIIEMNDTVVDDANYTNHDNKTGYQYGNKYVPNGHVTRILNKRFGCLGKQVVNGTMQICKLSDNDFNFYSDNSPAKLDTTEGDAFMYEPKYWYKGINDILGTFSGGVSKKYSCFSANSEVPKTIPVTIQTLDEIKALNNYTVGSKVTTGKTSLTDATSADANYSICKIDVSGYKFIRFPSVTGINLVGAIFVDSVNKVVKNVVVGQLEYNFVNGMYVISAIPANAKSLYFTIHNNAEFYSVVLSNSLRVEDMEPDWVEHKECLTAMFESINIGAKIYSASVGNTAIANLSMNDFIYYAEARNLKLVDWEMNKDIANLFFAKYGRRDVQSQMGAGVSNVTRIVGESAFLGFKDTVNPNNEVYYAWYVDNTGNLVRINNTRCLGYENWYGNVSETMINAVVPNNVAKDVSKIYITMPNGSLRKILGATSINNYVKSVHHQRYMDNISVSTLNGAGSSNTYYCDSQAIGTTTDRCLYRSGSSSSTSAGVTFFGQIMLTEASASLGSRLAFRGNIVQISNPATFKNIQNWK
ncbi:hypothetical protein [Sphingobacterium multivorum]|uniref:hypothetical protein n=1 Tax=Sphingobacterium multivorum TaxID=28454 RepID=UPI0028A787AA|nr:hypothetical protein [Sphingobacterium multivorum]